MSSCSYLRGDVKSDISGPELVRKRFTGFSLVLDCSWYANILKQTY